MKLLKSEACHSASDGGNVRRMTVMGDARMDVLSDRGSTPRSSTLENACKHYVYRRFFMEKNNNKNKFYCGK